MALRLPTFRLLPQLAQAARPSRICPQCCRAFSTTPISQSGHNKWSKIKHTKGRADQKKTSERTIFVQAITLYSKLYGPDPNLNTSLANAISIAKKASTPKNVIDQAVARGQGRSLSGATLETMKFEVMIGPNAFILDVETDNKLRALQDVNVVIRKHKGRTGATEFFFSRLGRVVFEKHDKVGLDEIMDEAIELGAEDLEADDEGNMIVWSQPTSTMQIAQGVAKSFDLKVLSSEIIWSPNEDTRPTVDSVDDVKSLAAFVEALSELPEVQAIYSNAAKGPSVPEEEWEAFEDNLDS
ncbi:hypothetical protein KVR01_008606 [Diaporthe batatas]|uniref:uncharacterized protein n=1 Tax=Diaporthe batatas TaxID=748121 RepID=UPI001D04AAB4|nr:uncharacterized protein KVR01_008606 [Diaporthe batatas]KAG8161619.1 hypothetical protein KVR01_008606 [Diaporthe batatas]